MAAFFALILTLPLTTHIAQANSSMVNTVENQMPTINVNSANAEQLASLKGVGKVKAQAIVNYRDTHGKLSSLDGLLNVKGIGEKVLEDNLSKLSI